jgi:hypothetical protein
MRKQSLSRQERLLGIITTHPVTKNETMPPVAVPATFNVTARQTLCWKAQSITHGGA